MRERVPNGGNSVPLELVIDGNCKAGWARSNHRNVVDSFRIQLRCDAEKYPGLRVGGRLQHFAIGADHQGQFVRQYTQALHEGASLCVRFYVQRDIGIAIASEETL